MKSSLQLPAAAGIVVAVVGLVWGLARAPEEKGDAAEERSVSARGPDRARKGSPDHHSRADRREARKARGTIVPLQENEIDELGRELKSEDEATRRRAFERLLSGLTAENGGEIWDWVRLSVKDPDEVAQFYRTWGTIAGSTAVRRAHTQSELALQEAMFGWARVDPEAARTWLEKQEYGPQGRRVGATPMRAGLIAGMAINDPAGARDYVLSLVEAKRLTMKQAGAQMRVVVGSAVRRDGVAATTDWIATFPQNALRSEARGGVAREIASADPKAALRWLDSLSDDTYNGAAYYHAFHAWMDQDPIAVEEHLGQMPVSRMRDEAIKAFAHQMVEDDSALAMQWADNINEPSFRHRSYGETFEIWAEHDPDAARDHIVGMPNIPERDYALTGYAKRVVHEDPERGVQWANSIRDNRMRERALIETGRIYWQQDSAGARAWLVASELSPEARMQVVPEEHRAWFGTSELAPRARERGPAPEMGEGEN